MVNNALVVPDKPLAAADSRYAFDRLSMLSVEKVAMPSIAATVVVPESVAPAGPEPAGIATVTSPVKLVMVFPDASRAVTCTAGLIGIPAIVALGCTVNTNRGAKVAVMSNEALVADVRPLRVATSV